MTEVADATALKDPVAHGLHTGWVFVVPAVTVYRPAPHLVWDTHESVFRELAEAVALKNPDTQGLHTGWAVALPAVAVWDPPAHLVWAAIHYNLQSDESTPQSIRLRMP